MSDNIFVSRDNNIYQIDMTSSGNLRDTDLVLASREVDGVPTLFKVTGDKFGKPPAAPEITQVVLQQDQTNSNRFTSNSFTTVVTGNEESPTAPTLMAAEVEGALSIESATEPITTNAYSTSTENSVPLTLDGSSNLGTVFEVNDVVLANESYTPTTSAIIGKSGAPIVPITVTATGWGNNNTPIDGNENTQASSQNNTSGIIVFSGDLQNVTKVEVKTRFLSSGTATLSEGGSTVATQSFTGSGTQWYTIYEGGPISFDKYEQQMVYQGVPTSDDFYAIKINDQIVTCPGGSGTVMNPITSTNTILEFENDTDIQLFQVGDVVGSNETFSPNSTQQVYYVNGVVNGRQFKTPSDPGNAFDGNSGSRCQAGTPNEENGIGMVWSTPYVDSQYKIKLATNTTIRFVVNDDWDTPIPTEGTLPTGVIFEGNDTFNISSFVAARGEELKSVYVYSTAGTMGVNGFNNGGGWISQSYGTKTLTDVKVTATDVSTKTIAVDGGDWDTSNQSQVWSKDLLGVDPSIGLPATNLFDGNTTTTAESTAGSPLIFIPTGGIDYTEKVECWIQSDGGSRNFSLNDGPDVPNLGAAWTEVATGSGTITKLECKPDPARSPAWSAIRVDGRILVDAVNDSQVWSSTATWSPSQPPVGQRAEAGFNGTTSSADGYFYAVTGGEQTVTFSDLEFTTLEIWTWQINDASVFEVTGNGTAVNLASNINSDPSSTSFPGGGFKFNATSLVTSPLQSIKVTKASTSTSAGFTAVFVDGKLLVDQGVSDLGDTKVSTLSPKRGEGTIKTINGAAVTIEPFVDNCFKEDQYLVFKTPKVIEVTPLTDPIDSFDSQTNTLTLTGGKDLNQLTNGDAVYMTSDSTTPSTQTAYQLTTSDIQSVVTGSTTVLTFDSPNPDLQYFKSGDILQGANVNNISATNISNYENMFDADPATYAGVSSGAVGMLSGALAIPVKSTLTVRFESGTAGTITLNDTVTQNFSSSGSQQEVSISFTGTITNFKLGSGSGPNIFWLKADGEYVTQNASTIVNTGYPVTNTMTVSGGTWDSSNQSETWSNNLVITEGNTGSGYNADASLAFDGDISTYTSLYSGNASSPTTAVLTPSSPITVNTGIRVYMGVDRGQAIAVNGVQTNASVSTGWNDVAFTGTLNVLTIGPSNAGSSNNISAIEINGRLLIDPVNDSQVWSDLSNVTGNPRPAGSAYDTANAFDGVLSGEAGTGDTCFPVSGTQTWTTPVDFGTITKLRLWLSFSNGPGQLEINDVDVRSQMSGSTDGWYEFTGITNLQTITWGYHETNNAAFGLSGIEINSRLVIDAGVRNLGDSKVTYQTNGGQGTVDTVDAVNNSIVIVPTGDRDNRWIVDNKAGTVFRAGSATKPAISQKAYLKFNGSGVVESIRSAPVAAQAMASRNPTLIFPAIFDTGNAPDVEMPNPTSLKTTISRTNQLGSASKSSNVLFPTTTTRSNLAAGAAATYTTDGFSEFVCMTKSHEGRAAEQRAIQHAENCQALKDAAEQKAQDYINDNP